MVYFSQRRHNIIPLIYLFTLVHLFLVPICFAKDRAERVKGNKFPKTQIGATSMFGPDAAELPYEDVVDKYLGIPYRLGGTGSRGIDCSGLSRKFYLEVYGIDLPHNSREQCRLNIFEPVPLDPDAFQSKDLLFFQNKNKRINHVGIYLEDGNFLHASAKKGVIISNLNTSYWKQRLAASRRVKDTVLAMSSGAGVHGNAVSQKTNEISIGYAADINEAVHVDIETFYSSPFTKQHRGKTDLFADGSLYLAGMQPGHWQGVRASTHLYPADWLRITPSLGMLDGPSLFAGDGRGWQIYGLETAVSPLSSRWSLAFSMQSLLNDSYFTTYADATDTDIGLHFNYWISNSMRFSIMGNWEGSYLMENAQPDALARDILSFNLDFSF